MKTPIVLIIILLSISKLSFGQTGVVAEDRLQKDTTSFIGRTSIGGYGNAFYQRDFDLNYSTAKLERFVLFLGHKISKKISFFSELEVEDAKVDDGGGEVALEQCYIKFNINRNNYITAGLFIPRIGILNENHLPNTFFGNERTRVETFIIPSTWRELGIGYYGNLNNFPLYYSAAIVNGLNSAEFEHGSLLRGGRFEGRDATANNLAVTGALQFIKNNLRFQVSGYYGGAAGLAPRQADSLKLTSGVFGTPVALGEADIQYTAKGLSVKALGTVVSIPDAGTINRAYANNTPETAYGAYGEVGYDVLYPMKKLHEQQLFVFARYEKLDMNAVIPSNGITDGTLNQQHVIVGLNYLPVRNVVIKTDVRLLTTGEQNPALIINPSPVAPVYEKNNAFLNIGIGYSF